MLVTVERKADMPEGVRGIFAVKGESVTIYVDQALDAAEVAVLIGRLASRATEHRRLSLAS